MKINNIFKNRLFVRVTLSGAVVMLLLVAVWYEFGRSVPHYDPTWFYMKTDMDGASVITPFRNAADCNQFATATKSKCFSGSEMTAMAGQNK